MSVLSPNGDGEEEGGGGGEGKGDCDGVGVGLPEGVTEGEGVGDCDGVGLTEGVPVAEGDGEGEAFAGGLENEQNAGGLRNPVRAIWLGPYWVPEVNLLIGLPSNTYSEYAQGGTLTCKSTVEFGPTEAVALSKSVKVKTFTPGMSYEAIPTVYVQSLELFVTVTVPDALKELTARVPFVNEVHV
jgi:hypothetical protein